MKATGSIFVNAEAMLAALATAAPKRRGGTKKSRAAPYPVTIWFDRETEMIEVVESAHALRGECLPAEGAWPNQVQIDGRMLRRLFEAIPRETRVELVALEDALAVLFGRSQTRLPRLDPGGVGGVKRRPIPRNPEHKGKVEVPPDPVGKRVELADTWAFSARVPVPQHRIPKEDGQD